MIKVIYYRNYDRLTIEGHAGSGEFGHDLVCSAVSILAHTLAANIGNLEEGRQILNATVDLQPGKAEIGCCPKTQFRSLVKRIFASVCVGFEILAAKSPQFISYEIHG